MQLKNVSLSGSIRHVLKINLLEWSLKRRLKLAHSFKWIASFYALILEFIEWSQRIFFFPYCVCLGKVTQSWVNIIITEFNVLLWGYLHRKQANNEKKSEAKREKWDFTNDFFFFLFVAYECWIIHIFWNGIHHIVSFLKLLKSIFKYENKQY